MCPVVKELKSRREFHTVVAVTGQHRQMLAQVLAAFSVEPDYDLAIMSDGQTLFDITKKALDGVAAVIDEESPDCVLVHGDTTTAFAASLAAFYKGVPVGHVEAGLRTYNLRSPFPEEYNRQAIDISADYLFAPTETSRANLLSEGKPDSRIYVTGNTAIDALKTTVRDNFSHKITDWAADSRLILLTAHRRENLGDTMRSMFRAIRRAVDEHPDVKLVYPVHLNPLVAAAAQDLQGHDRIMLTEPLDAPDFHNIIARSYLVLTDSGGIQEEAPSLGKPVLVLRDTTERPEGVEAGTLLLAGTDERNVYEQLCRLLTDTALYEKMSRAVNPYGDGFASRRIADILAGIEPK